jgi:uncharacterized RDD family membrane protein YckC
MEVKIIGRAANCDFVFNDQFISREHLQIIKYSETDFRIIDIDSTTGTYVNGQKIASGIEISVEKTDIIKIGNTLLKWNEFFKKQEQVAVNDIYATKPDEDTSKQGIGNNNETYPEELYQMIKTFAEDGIFSNPEKEKLTAYCKVHNIDYDRYILPLMNSAIDQVNAENNKKESVNNQTVTGNSSDFNKITDSKLVIYGNFGSRLGALIIDSIIVEILTVMSGFVLVKSLELNYFEIVDLIPLIQFLISWLYFAFSESSKAQATLGKKAVGLIVTDEKGKQISFIRATGRYFAKIISALIILIGYLMALWTEKKQALHDIISGCLIVQK